MYKICLSKTNVRINCPIGKGFHLVHDSYLFINAKISGDYFTVFQNVTISADKNGGAPTIGNNVTAYSNAVICGDIKIGDNCVIGANAFVNKNLSNNSSVIA